jgi:hypothetical protein
VSEKSGSAAATKKKSSSDSKATTPKKEAAKSTESKSDSGDSGASTTSKPEKGKAQKETVSSADVHYGYFSSVRTPAYRKGWDEIFGKKSKSGGTKAEDDAKPAARKKRAAIKQPVRLELEIGELPEDLRSALVEEVRRKVKGQRINYAKRNAAGAVRWNITCEIDR